MSHWVEYKNILFYYNHSFMGKYIESLIKYDADTNMPKPAKVSIDSSQDSNNIDTTINSDSDHDSFSSAESNSDHDETSDDEIGDEESSSDESEESEKSEESDLDEEELDLPPITEVYDLDNTIIETRSGNKFAKDETDWKFRVNVIEKFDYFANRQNYFLVIISNQAGISKTSEKFEAFKRKIESITKTINKVFKSKGNILYVFAAFALQSDDVFYRKPYPGCWYIIKGFIPMRETFDPIKYIGDAGGRLGTDTREKDHSCVDRKFAYNTGLEYWTPEEFFDGDLNEEAFLWGFDPRMYINTPVHLPNSHEEIPNFKQIFTSDTGTPHKFLALMIGYPGSGKTSFAKYLRSATKSYCQFEVLTQDDLGSISAVQKEMKKVLGNNKNVIIDCTNGSKDKRGSWIAFAKDLVPDIQVYIFEMTTNKDLSMHLNIIRARKNKNARKPVPKIVYTTYDKNFDEVSPQTEDIDGYYRIPFIPTWTDISQLQRFLTFTG